MEAQAQPVIGEDDQQEVIYLVVDENPQGQQVTQIVSDGQLIGQHAQIIMQDGKQAVLITDGSQQQVVLLDDEVGPEQVQSALQQGAVQQTILQQSTSSVIMTQSAASTASTSQANGSQVQYLVTEGGEILSPITQINQPVVTMATQQPAQQPQHQLLVTQSGLVRIGGNSKKKDGGILPGKSLINQAALHEAAAKSPRGKLEEPVLVMGQTSVESVNTQVTEQATLREVINEAVDKQISEMVPAEHVPTTDTIAGTGNIQLGLTDVNTEINSTAAAEDIKDSKDETDTVGFTEETTTEVSEAVEPDSTQSGCSESVNGTLDKEIINKVPAVDETSMVSVSSDIPPLTSLPDQVMQDDDENKSADEVEQVQVPQVFNMPNQTMEIDASDVFDGKEHAKAKVSVDDSIAQSLDTDTQSTTVQPTSTLIIHDPEGRKQTQADVMPSTVITVISPQSKKKKKRYDLMRQDESGSESQSDNSAKVIKVASDSIASRRERRTSKPTKYYGLEVDYEVYTADIYRSYRRGSESGDETAASRAKREQQKNIEDSFGFDVPSTDDEQPPVEKKRGQGRPRKSDLPKVAKEPPLTTDKDDKVEQTTLNSTTSGLNTSQTPAAASQMSTPSTQQVAPVKRGRGRPPKHPRRGMIKSKSPKLVKTFNQSETDSAKAAGVTSADVHVENLDMAEAVGQQEQVMTNTETAANTSITESVVSMVQTVVAQENDKQISHDDTDDKQDTQTTEMDATTEPCHEANTLASKTIERDLEQKTSDQEVEIPHTEVSGELATTGESVGDDAVPITDKLVSENELCGSKVDEVDNSTFIKPVKKGTPGRPKGRPRKNAEPKGPVAKRSSQSDGESPRRSGRAKEKPCYAESSGEESQDIPDTEKDVVTSDKLHEESNKVYSLQKEVTDLKFINDSLELRLAQQSGSPEEIRNLQARVDSLQMRNNELEAKLKNYEKSQKIGINIKGMKFSIKKDTASPAKSKPADVMRLREIELAEQELRAREAHLERREMKAKALDRELDERGAQLTKRESKLDRWERKLKSQEKEIEYKEKRLKRLENDLRDLGGSSGKRKQFDYIDDSELIVQQKDLQLWEEELRQREAEMLEKEKLLAATEKQLMALNTELNEKAEYLQAKKHSCSSGDEEASLADTGVDDDLETLSSFKRLHSDISSQNRKGKGRRATSASSPLVPWQSSSEDMETPRASPRSVTPKTSAKIASKVANSVKTSGSLKRKSYGGSQMVTPVSTKKQKSPPKGSGRKNNFKSTTVKASKETPKYRKSEGQNQKKKYQSEIKSPKMNKTRRK